MTPTDRDDTADEPGAPDVEAFAEARDRLVDDLQAAGYVYSRAVERAMRTVPREQFVPPDRRERAHDDEPLPIGAGQVVTAPHLVASMTELLEVGEGHRVLEVGTGSGYHAAVVAEIAGSANVVTMERLPDLAARARAHLDRAGYGDVTVVVGDGSAGFPGRTSFDRILVACAAPEIPRPLVDQLADDGRMVVPVGTRRSQSLVLVERHGDRVDRTTYAAVRFVPLVGEFGYEPGRAWRTSSDVPE